MPYSFSYASDLLATVNDKIMPGIADQVGTFSETLGLLTSSGRTDAQGKRVPQTKDELLSPDEFFRKTLRHTRGAARGSYKGYDVLNTSATRQLDAARQDWLEYYVSVPISDDEEIAARGSEATVRLWEDRINAGYADMADLIATGIWNSTASRTGLQSKGLFGMRVLGVNSRSWMGINSTSNTYWNPGVANSTGYTIAQLTDPTHANYILKLIRSNNLILSIGGKMRPSHIITTKTVWGYIADAIEERQRITTQITKSESGIETIRYDGLDITWDSYCPAYHMAFLSFDGLGGERVLGLKGRRDRWFHLRPPITPEDQMAKVAILVCHAVLYCSQPRLQGLFISVGAT